MEDLWKPLQTSSRDRKLSPFHWRHLGSLRVKQELRWWHGETLWGECGSIRRTEHQCDSPGKKSKMNNTLHETEIDIHKAIAIGFIKKKIKKKLRKIALQPFLWNKTLKCMKLYFLSVAYIGFDLESGKKGLRAWQLFFSTRTSGLRQICVSFMSVAQSYRHEWKPQQRNMWKSGSEEM